MLMFMKAQKQSLWVTGTLGSAIALPPAILSILTLEPEKFPVLWLFTPFAWKAIEQASASTIFLALLGQWSIFTLCTLRMTRQL
ncbi:MAG TPA: ABC transporter permease, partial [Cyanobacteria bacterium UBA11049]|nr:ABC transporter permease [Cyanobacteria bacterium UBA11049]